jgi:acyl carrier protein
MTQEEKLETLAEIFDCDAGELKPETRLDEIGWDSMSMLSVIAMAKARFDRKIAGAEIRGFTTVQDILAVMEK